MFRVNSIVNCLESLVEICHQRVFFFVSWMNLVDQQALWFQFSSYGQDVGDIIFWYALLKVYDALRLSRISIALNTTWFLMWTVLIRKLFLLPLQVTWMLYNLLYLEVKVFLRVAVFLLEVPITFFSLNQWYMLRAFKRNFRFIWWR